MIYRELSAEEFNDLASRILYEDNHLLVVNKKVGEIVQGDKTSDEPLTDTYKAFIAKRDEKPGQVFMGLPHRLDRPVSGITILAKTSKALERLNAMFRESDVHKFYWALVCAEPRPSEGRLEDMMWRNEKQNKSFVVKPGTKDAKRAVLSFESIAYSERYTLLEINLETGRHHQIRCQLSKMGMPIKGDLKYGAERSNPDGGISLHAYYICFEHPVSHKQICVSAPLPDDNLWRSFTAQAQALLPEGCL